MRNSWVRAWTVATLILPGVHVSGGELPQLCPDVVLSVGGTGSNWGQFDGPVSVAVDFAGNIHVADNGNDRVQVFSSAGTILTGFGSKGGAPGQFAGPAAIEVAGSPPRIYVSDYGTDRVQIFRLPDPIPVVVFGGTGSGTGQFLNPSGLAVGPFGKLYVTDTNNIRVQAYSSTGVYQFEFGEFGTGPGQFSWPNGVAVAADGRVYVSDGGPPPKILVFGADGSFLFEFGQAGNGNGDFSSPQGITFGPDGNLYVVDRLKARVQIFDPAGNFLYKFGLNGTLPGQFKQPEDVFVDAQGRVFVADTGNDRVQVMTLFEPLEVGQVVAARPNPSDIVLSWEPTGQNYSYRVTSGLIHALSAGEYGICLAIGIGSPSYTDHALPQPGQGFAYLVQAHSATCGSGPLGYDSEGDLQVNLNPGGCF